MNVRSMVGYAVGVVVLSSAIAWVFATFGAGWGIEDVGAALRGVAVASCVDVVVFALMARGLVVETRSFMSMWLVSVLLKIGMFGGAIGWAAASGQDARSLALGCAAGFVVLAHHSMFVLCRLSDRAAKAAAERKRGAARTDS